MSNEQFSYSHPLIGFLVANMHDINQSMKQSQYLNAAKKLYCLVNFLDPEVKNEIQEEILMLKKILNNVNLLRTNEEFLKILNAVTDAIYRAGYLEAAKMGGRPVK